MLNTPQLTPAQTTLLKGSRRDSQLPNGVIKFILQMDGLQHQPDSIQLPPTNLLSLSQLSTAMMVSSQRILTKFITSFCGVWHLPRQISHQTLSNGTWLVSACGMRSMTSFSLRWTLIVFAYFSGIVPRLQKKGKNKLVLVCFFQDVLDLFDTLRTGNQTNLVTKAIILVGFWGLARLGELTLHLDHPLVFPRSKDVSFSKDGRSARLRLRMAKAASHGDLQILRLRAQPNRMDPVNILHEVLQKIPGTPNDPLFPGESCSVPMDRPHVVNLLKANGPQDEGQWSGHNLRIGGASFQYNAGRPLASMKRLGRWKSSAYRTYIHKYSPLIRKQKAEFFNTLHFWFLFLALASCTYTVL